MAQSFVWDINLLFFVVSMLVINLTPGPDVAYIVQQSLTKGLKAGITAIAGIALGLFCHLLFAAFGVSGLFVKLDMPFIIFKILGVAYLFYLAYKAYQQTGAFSIDVDGAQNKNILINGFLINLLNPKVVLFFLSVLPQFVNSQVSRKSQVIFLGLIFIVMGSCVNLIFSYIASRFRFHDFGKLYLKWKLNIFSSLIFIALAIHLAFLC